MGFRHAAAERRPFSCNLFDMRRAGIATLALLSLAGCETATGAERIVNVKPWD